MPPLSSTRTFCCGKGGNIGHSGVRDDIMIVGDRFDTDIRAGVLAGIKSCLIESGEHSLDVADAFPTDLPSFTAKSIADILPRESPGEERPVADTHWRIDTSYPCTSSYPRG